MLCLHSTPARKDFKAMAGQNNHFLITLLVGLSAVEAGTAPLPAEFHTSWNPRDVQRSAQRGREFAIKALLAWTTDAVDSYVKAVVSHPVLASRALREESSAATKADKGRAGQIRAVAELTGHRDSPDSALVCAAVVWRNRLVHSGARNRLGAADKTVLRGHEGHFSQHYQGLAIDETIQRIQKDPSPAPTFKEITAIVRAAHEFVRESDVFLLAGVDLELYLRHVLQAYVHDVDPADQRATMRRIHNVWGKDVDRRQRSLFQIAANRGMSVCQEASHTGLRRQAIGEIAAWSPKQAEAELRRVST